MEHQKIAQMKYPIILLLLFLVLQVQAQNALPDSVAQHIHNRISNEVNVGIALGILDASGPQYFFFGSKTVGGEAVDQHSIFEIGSISKTFTAILLAQMVLEGEVSLDDPVQDYLPDTVNMPTWEGKPITLGQLSDHTSSLPRLPDNMDPEVPANPYADYTVEQMYAFLNRCALTREPGSQYEYSNLAQGLLGHILALRAGKSYEELMLETLARPLDMQETRITLNGKMKKDLAPGHSFGRVVPNWDIPTLAGAGAIRSSVHDMLLYLGANMGLKESALYPAMELTHKVRHDKAGNMRVGLAWHIAEGSDGDIVWHNGGTGGYRAFAGFCPDTGKGVVVLANSDQSVDNLGFVLLDPNTALTEVKKSVAAGIRKAIAAEGPEAAWDTYKSLKDKVPGEYDLNEQDLNNLGYFYLEHGDLPASLAVFRINVEAFPTSSNVFDSFAEALMKDGQKKAAIENYQKSLELNPGNSNAVEKLEELGVKMDLPDLQVDEAILETYVGSYQLAPNFNIVITRDGAQLFGQATGQPRFELFARSETEFYLKVVDAQVAFNLEEGEVKSLTLFQGGQVIPGQKIE